MASITGEMSAGFFFKLHYDGELPSGVFFALHSEAILAKQYQLASFSVGRVRTLDFGHHIAPGTCSPAHLTVHRLSFARGIDRRVPTAPSI